MFLEASPSCCVCMLKCQCVLLSSWDESIRHVLNFPSFYTYLCNTTLTVALTYPIWLPNTWQNLETTTHFPILWNLITRCQLYKFLLCSIFHWKLWNQYFRRLWRQIGIQVMWLINCVPVIPCLLCERYFYNILKKHLLK